MWEASEDKHEEAIRIFYEIYIELAKYLRRDLVDFLWEKITRIKTENLKEMTIHLIKTFTYNAIINEYQD